jgi:hypothetical protein
MALTAFLGGIRTGKSLKLLDYACCLANERRSNLITNFALDFKQLRRYAGMRKLGWLAHLIDHHRIVCIQACDVSELIQVFLYPESVVAIDEAHLYFSARDWKSIPKTIIADITQSGKIGIEVLWCSQRDEAVDKNFRELSTDIVYARGVTRYNRQMRRPELVMKRYYHFSPETFDLWMADKKARRDNITGLVKSFLMASKLEMGVLNECDRQLFKCYSSFSRLDKGGDFKPNLEKMPAYRNCNFNDFEAPVLGYLPPLQPLSR